MRTIAFYLPQFHEIPENDAWWGKGFTEWVNVRRARPQYGGHRQPRSPGELGEYCLTDAKVMRRQTELAQAYDVNAFCMYFYWFDGKRVLEKPVEAWRQDNSLLPYCLSWANESWTRRWDGKSRDVLIEQTYPEGYAEEIFFDLLPHFQASHYVRIDDLPILVVHRADLLPDPAGFAARLRKLAQDDGLAGLYLIAAETTHGLAPGPLGFDAVVEFPPVGCNTLRTAQLKPVSSVSADFRGRLMSYQRLCDYYTSRKPPNSFVRFRCVVPGWDNTARRQNNSTVYIGSTAASYAGWLRSARLQELTERGQRGAVFVNAWNEWAEGAFLEPDDLYGRRYLEATQLNSHVVEQQASADECSYGVVWSRPQLRSLALAAAGSGLNLTRRVRLAWRRGIGS
ncbi:glycoside hydrolase family 99-like domain-containing protein [Ilumatobacter sp.]|uniref:glycosyltransferase WbsX family protein n=1 Tax=Ilumatobacter sp. TaxID=1967498 RepID=UPI00375073C1